MKKDEKELNVKKEEEAADDDILLGGFPMPNIDDLIDDDLKDPEVYLAWMDVSENPANLPKYQNNPKIMKFHTKLTKKIVPGGDPNMVEALNDPELCLAYFDLVHFPANITKYKDNPKAMKIARYLWASLF